MKSLLPNFYIFISHDHIKNVDWRTSSLILAKFELSANKQKRRFYYWLNSNFRLINRKDGFIEKGRFLNQKKK